VGWPTVIDAVSKRIKMKVHSLLILKAVDYVTNMIHMVL
jgi:hypothetical protein